MNRSTGMPHFTGAFILAGTSVVAAHFVSAKLGPFSVTAASLFLALPALLAVCGRKMRAHIRRMGPADWLLALLQAVFGVFLFRLFLLMGLPMTSSVEAGILTGVTPAATALLAALALREPVGRNRAAGVACTVGGVVLLQGIGASGRTLSTAHLAGNLLVLLAALSESAFNILSRVGFIRSRRSEPPDDPICQAALVTAAALALCLAPALLERPAPRLAALDLAGWLALAWYGPVSTALAYICWYAGIRRSEASVAAAFSGLMPLTAVALSVLLLGERPGWLQWAGGLLVVAGMALSGANARTSRDISKSRQCSAGIQGK